MKLVGLMLARNESWILRASLSAAQRLCDAVVVLDHASTDETPGIIAAAGERGEIISLRSEARDRWDEMHHREMTLNAGRAAGGTHFAIIDADEILCAHLVAPARAAVERLPSGNLLTTPMIPLWRGLDRYRDDASVWSRSSITLAFADRPDLTWRPAGDGYQHHHREPYGARGSHLLVRGLAAGGVMHAQFANWRRLVAKHAWYRAMEMVRYPGRKSATQLNAQYDQALNERELRVSQVPVGWWDGLERLIDLDGEPWQIEALRELVRDHGAAKFAGLDLKGLAL